MFSDMKKLMITIVLLSIGIFLVQKIIDSGLVAKTGFKPESLTPDRLGKVNKINSRSGKFDDEGINNSEKDIGSDEIGDDRADDLKDDFNNDDNVTGNDGGNDGRSDGGSDEVGDDRADDLKDDFNNDDNVTGNDGGNDGRSDDGLDEVGDDRADDLKDDFNNDDNMKDNDDNGYDNEDNETHTDDEDLNYMKEESIEDENERLKTSPYIFHEEEKEIIPQPPKMQGTKVISQWKIDSMYHKSFSRCSYNQCRWDSNNSLADAVLFKASSVRSWKIEPFPRKPGQRWVFYTIDPAIKNYGLDRKDVAGQFNATSTYQLRSDYSRIFGKLRRVPTPKRNFDKIFDGKQKQVAWFVSHCSTWSKREVYIKRMREIIPVDVFGACGNLTCGESPRRKAEDGEVCLPLLSKHYKFYLAFENSYCKDYVTEKFFKLFQDVDVIPVVQGAFEYKKYLPSNIFIDSSDFKSPEKLAMYLLKLSKDKDQYVKMLKRKAGWSFIGPPPFHCLVCEKLHTGTGTHFYPDMVAAFNGRPSDCYPPKWLQDEAGPS